MAQTIVTLGTATPGGGFPVYGEAFAATINGADPTLLVEPRNTKGSTENVPLIEAGKLDLGQVTGEVMYEALAGVGRPPAKFKLLWAMYSSSGMFIVRGDSAARTIADLKGKPVAWGARGSGFIVLARYAMDGLGLDFDRDFQSHLLDKAADGPAMVLDGRATAMWGGGVGWPSFTTIASGPAGARFIAPTADERARILAKHSFIKPVTLAAKSYPGQDGAVETIGSWSYVIARTDLPEELGYRLAHALHRGEAALGARLAQARESTLRNTIEAAPDRNLVHPGVLRRAREALK